MNSRICIWALIVPLLCVIIFRHKLFGYGKMPDVQLAASISGSADPCAEKQRCVLAFFAPWCPTCKESLAFVADMQHRFAAENKVGIKIIVGMDEQPKLEEMARHIGGQVFLDTNDLFRIASGAGAVPAWWVINQNRTILAKGSGFDLSGGNPDERFALFASKYMGLGAFIPKSNF